jgi:hypothetical protein
MVEDIERVKSELQADAGARSSVLDQRHVRVVEGRADDDVATHALRY